MKETNEQQEIVPVRERGLSRRVLLRGTAAGVAGVTVAGCAGQEPPVRPEAPDPEAVLLGRLIAGKEQIVTLYQRAARPGTGLATALEPFERRHLAHLAELRRRLPPGSAPATGASGSAAPGSPPSSPAATAPVTVARLRDTERRSAASRSGQLTGASPALAQLVACMGACEAAHAIALSGPPYQRRG